MSDLFVKPGLSISDSGAKILQEMLKDVPPDSATATVELTKDGTQTIAFAARVDVGGEGGWILGVGGYQKKEKDGDVVKGAGISISW